MADLMAMVGAKIEMKQKQKRSDEEGYTYYSKVSDVLQSGRQTVISATMPILEGHVVPLSIGSGYIAYFYLKSQIFEAEVKVINRSKDQNIFMMDLELESELKKVQRRDYYRLPCDMEVAVQQMNEAETALAGRLRKIPDSISGFAELGKTADISGGGIRIRGTHHYDKNCWMLLKIPLALVPGQKGVAVMGKIIASYPIENNSDICETRIQFKELPREVKEGLVKYIYMEQRRMQQKQRNI